MLRYMFKIEKQKVGKMSQDGADLGFTPDGALKTVLGGDQSGGGEIKDMAEYLDDAPELIESYDDGARLMGKIFLDYLREHPEDRDLPTDDEGDFERDAKGFIKPTYDFKVVREGLYTKVRDTIPESLHGLSGFQVGWAANAARKALGLDPGTNPAIVTVGDG